MFGLIWLIIKIIIAFYVAVFILSLIGIVLGSIVETVTEGGEELKQETISNLEKSKKKAGKFWKEIKYIATGN